MHENFKHNDRPRGAVLFIHKQIYVYNINSLAICDVVLGRQHYIACRYTAVYNNIMYAIVLLRLAMYIYFISEEPLRSSV